MVVGFQPSTTFLGKSLWKAGTWPPSECCTRCNHSFEDKFQRRKPTIKEEIFGKKVATTILNALHLTN